MASRGIPSRCTLSLALGTFLLLASVCSAVNVLPYQVPFLRDFAKAQNWTAEGQKQLGWAAPWKCGNMTGVVCDATGNIVNLVLAGAGTGEADDSCFLLPLDPASGAPKGCPFPVKLTGEVPASIGKLTALSVLDLSNQILNGSIPEGIFNITKLTSLKLYGNNFNGTIPRNLSQLTNLQSLDLSYVKTFRRQPLPAGISLLDKLTKLKLAAINANGSIPDSYSLLTDLQILNLGANRISGSIPDFIGGLTGLADLTLSQNNLTNSIPADLGDLSELTRLQLRLNKLNGSVPAALSKLVNLQWLDLGYNPTISGDLPPSLSQLRSIRAPDGGVINNAFIILKTNTNATCPRPTKKNCLGPPPVNTTSQFCQWVCLTFCNACADGKYVKGNSSGTDVGGQPVTATVLAPPPPSSPPEAPTESPPPADNGTPEAAMASPPPAPGAASSASYSWLTGVCTILAAFLVTGVRW